MSYSKLIHEYLDGQLNDVKEDVLFAQLAKNPDLRVDFNQQVHLQNVAQNDLRMISPPVESTNKIFASLGFSIPSNDYMQRISADLTSLSKNMKNTSAGAAIMSFWKKHLTTVMAVIITAGLTTSIFVFSDGLLNNNNQDLIANNQSIENANIPIVSSSNTDDILPAENNGNENLEPNKATASNTTFASSIFNSFQSNENISAAVSNTNQEVEETKSSFGEYLTEAQNVLLNSSQDLAFANSLQRSINMPVNLPQFEPSMNYVNVSQLISNYTDDDIAIFVTKSLASSGVKYRTPESVGDYEDLNISILYKLIGNLSIGIQGGIERYDQRFSRLAYGENNYFQQNPQIVFGGAVLRYEYSLGEYFSLGKYLAPYVQLFGGTSSMGGYIVKPQFGLVIPFNSFAFNIGYEYNSFNYYVDKKSYKSNKDGLYWGFGYSF